MVHIHMFRTAFSAGTRERRLLGMAGEAPFRTAAELDAEHDRIDARLNSETDDTVMQAEVRLARARLAVTGSDTTLEASRRRLEDRLTNGLRERTDARNTLTTLRTTQTAKRAEILGKLNVAGTRGAGLIDARNEINTSLTAIDTLAGGPATFIRNDLIAQHTAHISGIQNLAPTPALTPVEKNPLMTTLATETGADAASKERLGFHYLRSVGYQEVGGNLMFTKVFDGAGPPLGRTISLTYRFDAAVAPAGEWKVGGIIGDVAIPEVPAATLTRAHIDGLITAAGPVGAPAAALINPTTGVARTDIATHLGIALNVKDGINAAAPVAGNLQTVRDGAVSFEATRAAQGLRTLTAAHETFKNGSFTTAFLAANRVKTESAVLDPSTRRARVIAALDAPAVPPDEGGLRTVATARKNLLMTRIRLLAVPAAPSIVPSNIVATIDELRRQMTDIDNSLRTRVDELGVAEATATTPATAPAETSEAVRNFRTAVDAAINPLSATSNSTALTNAQTALGRALTTLPADQRDANKNYIVERARAKGLTATIAGTTVTLAVAPAGSTPERPAATVPSFLEALNDPRQVLQFLRIIAPMLSMLSGRGMSPEALSVAFDRMDLQLQLRDAEARLVAFDRANPRATLSDILRAQRTAIETEIADIRRRIAALPAAPAISGAPATGSESAESIAAFATNAAAAINRYLAPNVASVVGNRYIVINCVGKPPEVVARMNGLMARYGSAVPATGTAGLPEGANRPNSNIIAFDAVTLNRMVSGDVNAIVRAPTPFTAAPAGGVATGPVAAPIVSASSVAGVGIPPKPVLGASSRRAS